MLLVKIPRKCKLSHGSDHRLGAVLLVQRKPRRRCIFPPCCLYVWGQYGICKHSGLTQLWHLITRLFKIYVTFPGHEIPRHSFEGVVDLSSQFSIWFQMNLFTA